jgi:hypothetical protein
MCDFRFDMKSKVETEWQPGWKLIERRISYTAALAKRYDVYVTGYTRRAVPIQSGMMLADAKPTQRNNNGWYIYLKPPEANRSAIKKVYFKGKCVYGKSWAGNPPGVRAEIIRFARNPNKRMKKEKVND